MTRSAPRRGELYWVDFDPARGMEQAGRRPALVVQNDTGNTHSPYTVIAAVSSATLHRSYPFTVPLEAGQGNLPRACHVNCAQLLTIDQERLERRIGSLDEEAMARVAAALKYELGLP